MTRPQAPSDRRTRSTTPAGCRSRRHPCCSPTSMPAHPAGLASGRVSDPSFLVVAPGACRSGRHASALDSRDRGVTRAVAVAIPGSRSRQRSTSSSRVASAPVGNFSPSPASAGPPAASASARSWLPGLWAITMADDTPVDTCRSRSRSCAAPAPDGRHARSGSRGRPPARQDGRQRLAGPQRRGAQHHRRPNLRGCQVGRQDFGGSPAPRRQGPVGIGKAGLVPAGLGMAEQPEALHSGASVVAVRVPGALGMRRAS
jgi:hypothetical protein